MILNGAYLVEADRVDGLRGLVDLFETHYRALGARIELTGPWPPYNFFVLPRRGGAGMTTILERDVALIDVVDRLLGGGVVIAGRHHARGGRRRSRLREPARADHLGRDRGGEAAPAAHGQRGVTCFAIASIPARPCLRSRCSGRCARAPSRRSARLRRTSSVTPAALWRHEEVVEALMEDRDLLPVRYGTLVDDDAAAIRAVDARSDELAAALDFECGARSSLSVRAVGDPEDGDGEAAGERTCGRRCAWPPRRRR